jgi:hypothetical protein
VDTEKEYADVQVSEELADIRKRVEDVQDIVHRGERMGFRQFLFGFSITAMIAGIEISGAEHRGTGIVVMVIGVLVLVGLTLAPAPRSN